MSNNKTSTELLHVVMCRRTNLHVGKSALASRTYVKFSAAVVDRRRCLAENHPTTMMLQGRHSSRDAEING